MHFKSIAQQTINFKTNHIPMKTTDPRDPLDQKIDQMLADRPIKADERFLANVLEAVEQATPIESVASASWSRRIAIYALPIAAAIALAFTINALWKQPATQADATNLSLIEAQEIFELTANTTELSLYAEDTESADLQILATFDAIFFEIES
jgi:hypothetical protein